MLVVTQVRQAPQHACVAGAISAARFSIGSARVVNVEDTEPLAGPEVDLVARLDQGMSGRGR